MATKIYKVWQVNSYVKMCLEAEDALNNIMVEGEISNFKLHSSGHCYFSLKDEKSSIKCVAFRSSATKFKFMPENGMKVIAKGSISVYERDGVYQLYVSNLTPQGVGEVSLALEQLKAKLETEGLFSLEHKLPIPTHPKTIGVITARTGAVIRDICHVGTTRNPYIKIILYSVKVQGEGAAKEIAQGIEFFNKSYPVDTLIVGRGGGSKEDLWAFNEEEVVRAVFNSKIPIISAVGHEIDTTLIDLVSDQRAATPSQAAEFAVPLLSKQQEAISALQEALSHRLSWHLREKRVKLDTLSQNRLFRDPRLLLMDKQQQLDIIQDKLLTLTKQRYNEHVSTFQNFINRLDAMNPLKVINRGYAVIQRGKNTINSTQDLSSGDNISIRLKDGLCEATVNKIIAENREE